MATRTITIQDTTFTVPVPYAAGHVLTEPEATALNQAYAEAIRNNNRTRVDKAKADGPLTDEKIAALQGEINDYCASFVFSGGGGRTSDPIDKEAKTLAQITVDALLAKHGITKAQYKADGKYEAKIAEVAELPEIRKQAEKTVRDRQKAAAAISI